MAIAMLRIVTLGGEQEFTDDETLVNERSLFQSFAPSLSCFLNGLLTVVAQLLNGQSVSFGRLFPLPFSYFSDLHFSDSS